MSTVTVAPLDRFGFTGTRTAQLPANRTAAPALPVGRSVNLGRRGTTFIREIDGPDTAPTLMLLHGWGSTADLNWNRSYRTLAKHHRVVALDHRGHGRGIRSGRRFSLEDCADDVVALADALGVETFIPVGYSMGGSVASLVWQRHRERVDGLVLCATGRRFNETLSRRAAFRILKGAAVLSSTHAFRSVNRVAAVAWSRRLERRGDDGWAIEQILPNDWSQVLAAGHALGRFDSTPWIGDVDVPAAVVATLDDDVVPTSDQLALASGIPDATVHQAAGGHAACGDAAGGFVTAVDDACRSVAARAVARSQAA